MKYSKLVFKVAIVFISLLAVGSISSGQTLEDFREAYNNGVIAQQANDLDGAITYFNKCIEIYAQLGTADSLEAEDIVYVVESNMPALYYKVAMELYNDKKLDEAIEKFEETAEVADKYNDPGLSAKASKIIPQLYYMRAGNKYGNEDFEGALADYDKAIELDPEYDKAYYMKSLIYKKQEDEEAFLESTRKAIEFGEKANNGSVVNNAKESASKYFLIKGNEAKEAEKYENAVKYIELALEFNNEDPVSYYILASVNNLTGNYDKAIESAKSALAYEVDDDVQKARIYYEMANALKEKGENEKACDAYKKASYGAYKEAAEYQIKHVLNCEQ
jgi:tetratricopeptide (TPR) repeat protein